jgi:hypothetical protein
MLAGAVAGAASALVCSPLDVIRARMQIRSASNAHRAQCGPVMA